MEFEAEYKDGGQSKGPGSRKSSINLKPSKKGLLMALLGYLVFLGIYVYFANPIFNVIYSSNYIFVGINLVIITSIIGSFFISQGKLTKIILTEIGVLFIIFIIISILSSPIINAQKYYNLIGDVETKDYNDAKDELNTDLIPVVDYELANRLGDKVLGEDIGLGSQYEIGEYYLISTPDDIVWVAPLEPQDFFKWLQNRQGSPGYIYVSATNPNDVRLVKEAADEPINLKYTSKSYFNNNIKRHTYFNGNMTKGLVDYSFEIDDEGRPFWVVTAYKPTIGFSGEDVSGVAIIDAQTGEVENYKTGDKNIPEWVDRIYPKAMVQKQLVAYGAYKNGWINTITAQKEMVTPTEGISYMFVDSKPYYYTGMTSIQNDESTVGFVLHSPREKQTSFYKVNGATETAAKKSAQGKVQQYNYVASNPILLNIYNKPSYFMTLKDSDGLVKQYAFVSVENYNIVGIGNSLEGAKKDYYNQLKDNNTLSNEDVSEEKASGKISRINYFEDYYYLKIDGKKETFIIDKDVSNDLILTEDGDDVEIKYIKEDDVDFTQVTEFKNKTLE